MNGEVMNPRMARYFVCLDVLLYVNNGCGFANEGAKMSTHGN